MSQFVSNFYTIKVSNFCTALRHVQPSAPSCNDSAETSNTHEKAVSARSQSVSTLQDVAEKLWKKRIPTRNIPKGFKKVSKMNIRIKLLFYFTVH